MNDTDLKKNILIVSGGRVDLAHAALWLNETPVDFVIGVDSGGETALELGLELDLLIGDLDSAGDPQGLMRAAGEVRIFEPEKDDTDTGLALAAALEMRPENIFILGGTGERMDHTFTTVMSLEQTLGSGVHCEIVDGKNRIYMRNGDFVIRRDEQYGEYVSFVPVSDKVVLSLEGMRYDGVRICVERGATLCQSNEIVEEEARIKVHEGVILVFESRD